MHIHERVMDQVTVLDLEGQLTGEETGTTCREEVQRVLEAGRKRILLNMEQVTYIDSLGLGQLLTLKKLALVAGAEIKLLRPRPKIYGVLVGTSLTKIFDCFEDEAAAVASFPARP